MAVALGLIGLYFQLARPAVGAPAHGVEHCEGTGEGSYRVLELEGRNASLVLFGARHRTDPADPIFDEIERRVAQFRPTIMLVEGSGSVEETSTRELAITHHGGEMGFLCWLARERRIPCRGTDLTEAEEAHRLLRHHSPDEVLLSLVVRVLAYFNPKPASQRPPGDLVDWAIHRYGPLVGLESASERDVARTCNSALGRAWKPTAITTEWHDPRKSDLLTQRMSRESNDLREPFIVEQILNAAVKGERVFASLGEGHVCDFPGTLTPRWNDRAGKPTKLRR